VQTWADLSLIIWTPLQAADVDEVPQAEHFHAADGVLPLLRRGEDLEEMTAHLSGVADEPASPTPPRRQPPDQPNAAHRA
jgi:hypothetical protein